MTDTDLNARIVELETMVAFHEETIGELNGVLVDQRREIDQLIKEVRHLSDKMREVDVSPLGDGEEGPPPHY